MLRWFWGSSLHMLSGPFMPLSSMNCIQSFFLFYFFCGVRSCRIWSFFFFGLVLTFLFFNDNCIFVHRTNRIDPPLKLAFFFALPALFGIWLGLSIVTSVLVGVGYGFFTPWVSSFEAFRQDDDSKKFFHCIVVNPQFGLSFPNILLFFFSFLHCCSNVTTILKI